MKHSILFLLSFSLLASSCQKSQKKIETPVEASPATTEELSTKPTPSLVKLLRADEAFIKAATTQKPNLMITDSLWNFYFALSLSEDTPKENIYKGHWLDLKEDGSYTKGVYDQTTDQGKFVYDYAKKSVEFRSILKDTSSEWNVKVDPDAMLLIGTAKFNNNPWQIKLLRRSTVPKVGVPIKNEKM
ncbi:MAG: hypothetical protein ABI851_04725 [Saprospiraceae bacterium]